jgi:predicted homoserine dehydrogenase-like protein
MGEGLAITMERMEGMRACVIVDRGSGRSAEIYRAAGVDERQVVETDDLDLASQAIEEGKRIYTTNSALASAPPLDITVEATGVPEVGARVAVEAIEAGKHVMQMNIEADATVGALLRRRAREAGVVYSLSGGDEPGAIAELHDFATLLGYDVVSVGKGKNNPLIPTANPETMAETAHQQRMNPKMLASFVDGSKTMMEMTTISNALGYLPDRRGMHGPRVTPDTLASTYIPAAEGGIFSGRNRVDYGRGVAPGVFVVFTTDHPKLVRDLVYLKVGKGPYWALYRPYHLTSLETPISIAKAVLRGETTLATDRPPSAETITVAKKDLRGGEWIDGIGGFSVYGVIERADVARKEGLLPLGLSTGARITQDVKAGVPLTYQNVELDESSTITCLRREQDALLFGKDHKHVAMAHNP